MRSSKLEEVLEPLFAFFATDRPFAEVSRLAVVSRNWRTAALKALKTAPQLDLSGFGESLQDEDVRLALVRVTSENLKRVDLSFCHHISASCMEHILQYMDETCSGVKEVDVTACSNEAVLRAVAIRARAVCGVHSALDLYTHLKSLEVHADEVDEEQDEEEQEHWKRYPFSYISRLLHARTPLLLFDPELAARKNALFQAAAHGTGSDVAMLLSLTFAVGDENESDEGENDQGDIRTYDVNEKDSEGDSPLLLACRSGNLEIAEILVVAGADVSAADYRGDTPLLAAVGAGKFELAEMLVSEAKADVNVINGEGASALHLVISSDNARSFEMFETLLQAGADMNVVRRDGISALQLAIVSGNARILNCRMMPKMIEYDEGAEISYVRHLSLAFLEPNNIFRWLKDGRSPRELLGMLCALMASAATERPMQDRMSHLRAFINRHIDLLQDPTPLAPLTVTDVFKQLALQEADSVFDSNTSLEHGVVWVNKPLVQHTCRWTMHAGGNVQSLVYSPDGSRLARAEGVDMVVCDAVSGFEVHRLKGHRASVMSVAFSADGTVIASGSQDRTVRLWDAETGSCKFTLTGHSRDNPNCTCNFYDFGGLEEANAPCLVSGHSHYVSSVAWNNDGTKLATVSYDNTVKVWSVGSADTFECLSTLSGHSNWVTSVAWSPDSTQIASGSYDNTVKLWNAGTFECQSTLTVDSSVYSVAFSPDGSKIAVAHWNKIQLFDAQTQAQAKLGSPLNVDSFVLCISYSPSGDTLAVGCNIGKILLLDAVTVVVKRSFSGHSDYVRAVTWNPDGTMLASGSDDKTVKLWDAQTGQVQSTLNGHMRSVTKLEYVDAVTLVSGSEDGTMRVWSVDTGAHKEVLDGGSFAFSKDNALEHKVGKYSITFEDDLLLISEGQSVVAFFRAPHDISTIGTAGERIGVGCKNGEVLQLRADWLV